MAYGSDATITLSIVAKDLASGNINKAVAGLDSLAKKGGLAGSFIQGVGQSFGQMLNPARLAGDAIGGVVDWLARGVRSSIEEETQLGRLDTALKNNVDNWDGNRDAIDKAVASGQDMAFQDDALRESLIKLLPSTHNAEEATRDMALAMDIARGRNIDLAAATDIVVKANLGNVGALKRAGIALEGAKTKTEILGKLQETYAGQAQEYAESTQGSMEAAQIAIDEAAESIGSSLTPAIKDLAVATKNDLVPALLQAWDLLSNPPSFDGNEIDLNFNHLLPDYFPAEIDAWLDPITGAWADLWGNGPKSLAAKAAAEQKNLLNNATGAGGEAMDQYMAKLSERAEEGGWFAGQSGAESFGNGFQTTLMGIAQKAAGAAKDVFDKSAQGIGNSLAGALRGAKDDVSSAMDDLMWAIKHPLALTKNVAKIEGELTSKNLQKALNSENPLIRRQAEQTQARLRELWTNLTGVAWDEAHDASGNLKEGYKSDYPGILHDARWFMSQMQSILDHRFKVGVVGNIKIPGVTDKGHEFSGGGRAAGGPVRKGVPYVVGEHRPELFIPDENGYIAPSVGSTGLTVNLTLSSIAPYTPSQMAEVARAIGPELVRWMRGQRLAPSF